MTALAWLIPAALFLGFAGLVAFLWALRNGQFEDLEGAGWRAIDDKEPDDKRRAEETLATQPGQGTRREPSDVQR